MITFSLDIERPQFTVSAAGTLRPGITCLTGPSGSGKSTLVKALAGLVQPQQGEIRCENTLWFSSKEKIHQPPQVRQVGYLPQGHMIFPHLSVRQNICYSQRGDAVLFERIVRELALTPYLDKSARQLSGGEQQRVALGRALYSQPVLLLLDEPLSALDTMLRQSVRGELQQIISEWQIPCLWVTHDTEEAKAISDAWWACERGIVATI